MANLIEIQCPGGDCLFVVLRVVIPRKRMPFAPFDDITLDLGHSPAVEGLVYKSSNMCAASSTHVASDPTASRTDRLGRPARLTFSP